MAIYMKKTKFNSKRHMESFLYNSRATRWFLEEKLFEHMADIVARIKYLDSIIISIGCINFVPINLKRENSNNEKVLLIFKVDNNFEKLARIRINK